MKPGMIAMTIAVNQRRPAFADDIVDIGDRRHADDQRKQQEAEQQPEAQPLGASASGRSSCGRSPSCRMASL